MNQKDTGLDITIFFCQQLDAGQAFIVDLPDALGPLVGHRNPDKANEKQRAKIQSRRHGDYSKGTSV